MNFVELAESYFQNKNNQTFFQLSKKKITNFTHFGYWTDYEIYIDNTFLRFHCQKCYFKTFFFCCWPIETSSWAMRNIIDVLFLFPEKSLEWLYRQTTTGERNEQHITSSLRELLIFNKNVRRIYSSYMGKTMLWFASTSETISLEFFIRSLINAILFSVSFHFIEFIWSKCVRHNSFLINKFSWMLINLIPSFEIKVTQI